MVVMRAVFFIMMLFPFVGTAQSYRHTDQVQVNDKPFGNSTRYAAGYTFDDEFNGREDLSFTTPKPDVYARSRVKTVSLLNSKGQLYYRCELDEKGQVVQTGIMGRKYFIQRKNTEFNKSHITTEVAYYADTVLMRLDSINIQVLKYEVGDTILTYHEKQLVSFMKGSLINQKNRYLNNRYLNEKIEIQASPFGFPTESSRQKKHKVYLKEKLRTDYDSLTFYLVEDVRYFMTPFHLVNNVSIPWETVQSHPFYKTFNQEKIENYAVDGAGFNEPIQYREQMYCGNSDYDREHYYDGRSYRYSKLENGLYDAFQLYYYPVDPNPPKREPVAADTIQLNDEVPVIEVERLIDVGPPRLSTPEISIIYNYRYEFFE